MKLNLSLLALAATAHGTVGSSSSIHTPNLVLETNAADAEKNETSGAIIIRSGTSHNTTSSGSIVISSGLSKNADGSAVNITAGNSSGVGRNGGTLFLSGGHGEALSFVIRHCFIIIYCHCILFILCFSN
jgi:hypothetical protein